MRRYWKALLGLAVVASTVCLGLITPAFGDGYTPAVPTSCQVSARAGVVGERVGVRIEVLASGTSAPTGSIAVTFSPGGSQRVTYSGAPVTVKGPKARSGTTTVDVVFTASDPSRYASCTGHAGVSAAKGTGGKSATPVSTGLPNTGGPHLGILLAGAGLVVAGGGLVERGRRKT